MPGFNEPELDVRASPDAHLILALSHAIVAKAKFEAKRIYDLMGEEDRAGADAAELLKPGEVKIWDSG